MAHYSLELDYAVPIPVGHRIQIEFSMKLKGLFSSEWVRDTRHPIVLDVDTGIEHYPIAISNRKPEERTFYARVLACRIGTYAGVDRGVIQTTLVLDPMEAPDAGGPYRSA